MSRKKQKLQRTAFVAGLTALTFVFSSAGVSMQATAQAQSELSTNIPPELIEQLEQWKQGVHVEFRNPAIWISEEPRLSSGIMMVPAREVLEGLGYRLTWKPDDRSLFASKPGGDRPELRFRADEAAILFDEQSVPGGAPSFIDKGKLWIPLRATAESIGLKVEWQAVNRLAVVTDPLLAPKFNILTLVPDIDVETPSILLQHMKDKVKADADVMWLGPEYYSEKSKVMIAAGEMPSLMLFQHPYFLNDQITESIAVNPGPYLEDYPTIHKLAQESAGARSINGQVYVIPRLSDPHHSAFPAIRKDWLDKLGLIVPSTMDELFEVMKAFANNDPDGNGKKDTYGFTGTMTGEHSLSWVEHVFTGSPERFGVKDGQVIDYVISDAETEALKWLAKTYKEGLLDPEMPVLNSEQAIQRMKDDRVGLVSVSIEQAAELSTEQEAWLPLATLKATSTSASIAPWNSAGNGAYIVSKMAKQDPSLLLKWLDYGMDMTLNDKWESLEGWSTADQEAVNSLFGQPDMLQHNPKLDGLPEKVREQFEASVEQWRKVSYDNTLLPEAEMLWNTGRYADLNQELLMTQTKVIMGALSIEEWNSYVDQLVASEDYRDMMKELNDLLKARK